MKIELTKKQRMLREEIRDYMGVLMTPALREELTTGTPEGTAGLGQPPSGLSDLGGSTAASGNTPPCFVLFRCVDTTMRRNVGPLKSTKK